MIWYAFMSANWVARQTGFHMTGGWQQGESSTNAAFKPIASFPQRFSEILWDVKRLGFDRMDLWTAHLNWQWATQEHLRIAKDLLEEHGVTISSYCGEFGATVEQFSATCRLARALDIDLLGGGAELLMHDKKELGRVLKDSRLRFGFENHPEKTPQEVLEKIRGADEEVVGVCADTGWFGTQGCDAVAALTALRDRVFYVHLKDVRAPGGHVSCRYGQGCVPIEACVNALLSMGYEGGVSIGHEPDLFDPSDDCVACRQSLDRWLEIRRR